MQQRPVPVWTLGWRLRLAASHAGLSQDKVASTYGVDSKTVGRWWHDKRRRWTRRDLSDYADLCGVPLDWLVSGEPTVNEPAPVATQKAVDDAHALAFTEMRDSQAAERDSRKSGLAEPQRGHLR